MKYYFLCILVFALLVAVNKAQAGSADFPPLKTVEQVDLKRYMGNWHEIARLPNRFQNGCIGSNATYSLRDDGEVDVINSCRDANSGKIRQARGRAWVVDQAGNARLKVSFFWPFRGDYWIIDLGPDYEFAVVGTPDRKYLWILGRSKVMSDETYAAILQRAEKQEFDVKNLLRESGS